MGLLHLPLQHQEGQPAALDQDYIVSGGSFLLLTAKLTGIFICIYIVIYVYVFVGTDEVIYITKRLSNKPEA